VHFIRPRRGLAALVSLLAVASLAAPARAATYRADIVTSISDPKGDVADEDGAPLTEARADVTAASVEYRPGEIAFTLNVAQPSDPRTDPNWDGGDSFALWVLDTNADQDPDFAVALVADHGLLIPGVVKPSNMEEVLCLGSGTYDGVSYGAVIAPSCIGNPASFGWGAGMFYKTANGTVAIDGAPDGDNLAGPISAPPALGADAGGYWLVGDDGGIFSFNAPFAGSTGAIKLNKPIVGMAADPDHKGYWFVASDGGIFAFDANFFGSTGAISLNKPIVGMTPTPSGQGYWLVASDGGIFAFGDAGFFGSTGAIALNKPIVGMASTPTGQGYWLVASDGGIFAFGDAKFFGSTGAMTLSQPIVGMASTGTGGGYWFVAADGGIFSFGDAKFYGAAVGSSFPVVGIAAAKDGLGYSIVRADGSVVNRGSAPLAGSLVGNTPARPIVGIAATL
jgi:ribosomal protein L24E